MKIIRLEIKDFRHIHNQNIEFGKRLTVITGQNSTGKSSVLGWISQACDFKPDIKTITGRPFKTKYSEVFRFCEKNDYSKEYIVSLVYQETSTNKENVKLMKTRHLKESEKGPERYRVDFDKRGVALDFPVIYLGLKRLIPLATEKDITQDKIELNQEEIRYFSFLSRKILILSDESISSERVKSTNKDILAMSTKSYGHLGNSAGQDNIGQIISSFISFTRLKQKQENSYAGGLLLIDEIDATLYSGSQIHLIQEILQFAKDNDIQIVFTTHSLEILEYLSNMIGEDIKINYLELKDGNIENKLNPPIQFLINKIKAQTGQEKTIKKIEILCEDKETELWCKNLINGIEFKKYLHIKKGPFGEGELSRMAESKHSLFKEVYFVLDGDCNKKYANKLPPRTIILPGSEPPERTFYKYLNELKDKDPFWIETDNQNFSKQTCFQDYQTDTPSSHKKWFKDPKLKRLFGNGYSRLFNRWKRDNTALANAFQEEFKRMIEKQTHN